MIKIEIQENISAVEVYYNGKEKEFQDFLKSIIKGYVSDDTISAENSDDN